MREASSRVGREAAVAVGTAAPLTLIAFAQGGYFPTTWGWAAVGFWWAVIVALLLRREIELSRLGVVALSSMVLLTIWTATSVLWSSDVTHTVLESERVLAYTGALAAFLLVPRRQHSAGLVGGVFAFGVAVCGWALATLLFPDVVGYSTLQLAPGRLFAPLGYWNALGICAAITLLLAIAYVDEGRLAMRFAAAAASPVAACVLLMTFSRGGVAGLVIGALAWIAISPRRLRLVAVAVILAPSTAAPVLAASRLHAITRPDLSLTAASNDGHRLALIMLGACVLSLVAVLVLIGLERSVVVSPTARNVFAVLVCAVVLLAAGAEVAREGSPISQISRAGSDLTAPPPATADPSRLASLSLNERNLLWSVAWRQYSLNPVLGAGSGTYAQYWLRYRTLGFQSVWSHGLYIGELAELGLLGLAMIVVAVSAPLLAAGRLRKTALGPATFACLVALAVHTGVDWDWQLPAVTMATLALAAYPLAVSGSPCVVRSPYRRLGMVLALFALVLSACGLSSNLLISRGQSALARGDLPAAKRLGHTAHRLAPWSDQPWALLGRAAQASGDMDGARADFAHWSRDTPNDWASWAALASVSRGRHRAEAAHRACWLNPDATVLNRPCSSGGGGG